MNEFDEFLNELLGAGVEAQVPEERRLPRVAPNARGQARIINPRTGRAVVVSSQTGRVVLREHQRQLVAAGVNLPLGNIGRARGMQARPGVRVVEPSQAQIRGHAQRTGAFRLQEYAPVRVARSITDFAKDISSTLPSVAHASQINIAFEDVDGARITRTIPLPRGANAAQFTVPDLARYIERFQQGETVHESGAIGTGFTINTSTFAIGSRVFPAGGYLKFTGIKKAAGRKNPYFKLVDFSGQASEGDCLLAVLKAVSKALKLPPRLERNALIRIQNGLPASPAPIEANPANIKKLAEYFGVKALKIVTGVEVIADAERTFDDSPARDVKRNLCTNATTNLITVASHLTNENDGGEIDDGDAVLIYLADNHYEYIHQCLPIKQCEITGDLEEYENGEVKKKTIASIRRRVIAQGRNWYADKKADQIKARINADAAQVLDKQTKTKEKLIVYDYETVYEANGKLIPYALGYIIIDAPKLEDADFDEQTAANFADAARAGAVTSIIRTPTMTTADITNPLLDEIANAPDDVVYTLISFNGARFDHFLLAQTANARGMLSKVFATSSGGLRSLTLQNKHSTLDLAKLIPATSLASACKGFQTMPRKVEGFSHRTVQEAFEAGKLYEWLTDNAEQLGEYLAGDVLSEASLAIKLSSALFKLTKKPIWGKKAIQTIGGHAWSLMAEKCPLPERVDSIELDATIRRAIVGGRVQVYPNEGKPTKIENAQLYMLDFTSLYPTAMAAVDKVSKIFPDDEKWGYYPSGAKNGQPTPVTDFCASAVGIYNCTIVSQPEHLPNVLPRREENTPLDWHYKGSFDTIATHIDILLIRKYGGEVLIHNGWIWPVVKHGLFAPFITPLADAKDRQDQLLAEKNPEANPALRMALKLLMNSASGKCCQSNYDDAIVMATGTNKQLSAESKMHPDKPITWIPLGGETCIMIGKKLDKDVYKKTAKPSILAVLIYSYSRALVWRTLCQHNVLYSDTDSGLFLPADYENIKKAFPQLDCSNRKKELGDLESELHKHSNAEAYLMAAKDYAVFLYDEKSTLDADSKVRVKGVNQRSDRLVNKGIDRFNTQPSTGDDYYATDMSESSPLSDLPTVREFYKRRYEGENIQVLCSQIVRDFKGLNSDAPFSLNQRFMTKNINA